MATKTTFIPVPGLDGILARSALMASEMEKIGSSIAAAARVAVPKDTTATEQSIDGGAVLTGDGWTAVASAGTPYAPFIEFGTEDTPTVPFMRTALDAVVGGGSSRSGTVTGKAA